LSQLSQEILIMPTKTTKSHYDVHPGVKMIRAGLEKLKAQTGKTLNEWVELVKRSGPATHKERREWLKAEHQVGNNMAWWIADRANGKSLDDDPEAYLRSAAGYVEAMYAGPKSGLRPLHDAIIKAARKLGKDVKVCPCQTIVPLYRNHVFAQIKPTTRTRIDLGFALGDTPATGRLIDTGGFAKKDRITHRIPISSMEDLDDDVKRYLKVAYHRDA
jgi:hypothetical protein